MTDDPKDEALRADEKVRRELLAEAQDGTPIQFSSMLRDERVPLAALPDELISALAAMSSYATLIQSQERERCAKIAELRMVFGGEPPTPHHRQVIEHIATAIRTSSGEATSRPSGSSPTQE